MKKSAEMLRQPDSSPSAGVPASHEASAIGRAEGIGPIARQMNTWHRRKTSLWTVSRTVS